jgi:hypothetical protein
LNYSEALPDRDEDADRDTVHAQLFQVFPPLGVKPLILANEINYKSFVRSDTDTCSDFKNLVSLRSAHETQWVKKSVRVGGLKPEVSVTTVTDGDSVGTSVDITPNSARLMLINKIHSTLKCIDDTVGSTAGASRQARYQGKFVVAQAGNSANAVAAAAARSTKVSHEQQESASFTHSVLGSQCSGQSIQFSTTQMRNYCWDRGCHGVCKTLDS